jgi:hypothetical protein
MNIGCSPGIFFDILYCGSCLRSCQGTCEVGQTWEQSWWRHFPCLSRDVYAVQQYLILVFATCTITATSRASHVTCHYLSNHCCSASVVHTLGVYTRPGRCPCLVRAALGTCIWGGEAVRIAFPDIPSSSYPTPSSFLRSQYGYPF